MKVIVVGPCCRGVLATVGSLAGRCGTGGFEREEVEATGGGGREGGGERRMDWPELPLRGLLSSRCGRVCAEGERRRRIPVGVETGKRALV